MEGKPIICKAAVCWLANEPLSIEDVEVAPPLAGEVRIKIYATGVCQTDALIKNGSQPESPSARFPCILGHEGAGIVESVGAGVTTVQAGDHVIPSWVPQCGSCKLCLNPKSNLCSKLVASKCAGVMPNGTSRFTCKGQTLYHFMGCSTFSQYTVVPDISVVKIDATAPLEKVCLLGCGIPTGFGAAVNTAAVEAESTCAIWGLGCVGLAAIMGCRSRGAKRIIGIDINSNKSAFASKFGATDFLNPMELNRPLPEVLMEMTEGGCDFTFECTGNADAMREALESCHKGWGICVVQGVVPGGHQMSTKPSHFLTGKTMKGSCFGGWKAMQDLPKLVEKYIEGKLMVDEFATFTIPLNDINSAFNFMLQGVSLRTVISMK